MAEKNLKEFDKKTDTLLYSCKTVFPFTLFRDSVSVDPTKVTIRHHYFFLSSTIETILVKDIRYVHLSTNPFFASLNFEIMSMERNPEPIKFLNRFDAQKIHNIIMGLVAIKKEGITTDGVKKQTLVKRARNIGSVST